MCNRPPRPLRGPVPQTLGRRNVVPCRVSDLTRFDGEHRNQRLQGKNNCFEGEEEERRRGEEEGGQASCQVAPRQRVGAIPTNIHNPTNCQVSLLREEILRRRTHDRKNYHVMIMEKRLQTDPDQSCEPDPTMTKRARRHEVYNTCEKVDESTWAEEVTDTHWVEHTRRIRQAPQC